MATEGPAFHDGSQCVAGVTFASTTAAGPSGSGQFLAVSLSTTGAQRSINVATTGTDIYGIMQNKPAVGAAADVCFLGVCKAVAGSTFTAGSVLQVGTSGTLIPTSAGVKGVAIALESPSAASQVFTVMVQKFGTI